MDTTLAAALPGQPAVAAVCVWRGHAEGYESRHHLKPGQKGTKRLVEQYGDSLLCVRYRTDTKRGFRLKTVELVVGEKPLSSVNQYRDGDMVNLVVVYGEAALRDRLKSLGGRWNPKEKLWQIPFGAIRGNAELEERIVPADANRTQKR